MKQLIKLITLFIVFNTAYAGTYTGIAVSNDNQLGLNTITSKLYLDTHLTKDVVLYENIKYYYDDTTIKALSNQWLDSNTLLTINNGGFFTTFGYRAYQQPNLNGEFKDRQEFTNGYNSNLSDNLSQSTFISGFRYSDGSLKISLENDLHYKINDLFSFDTNLSTYRYAQTKIIDDSYNLDGLIQLNYNITTNMPLYVSQELVRNLKTNQLINTTEIGIGYNW